MVPHAAILLLALVRTIAAAEDPRQLFHGPYKLLPGKHGRRADLNSPLFPIGTGPIAQTFTSVETTPQELTKSGATDSEPETLTERSSTAHDSRSNAELPPLPGSTRSPSTSLGHGGEITASHSTPVPTAVIVHETMVLLTNSSHSVEATSSSHDFISNTTRIDPTGLTIQDSTQNPNSSQRATPSAFTRASAIPIWAANFSVSGSVDLHVDSASTLPALNVSSAGLIDSTTNRTLGPNASFNPPRPTVCSGATLNIKGASLDYWYAETYTQVDSTFLIEFNANTTSTGWTLLPATTDILNITSAIENPACSSTTIFNADSNQSGLEYSCSHTPTPAAKATSVVEQTAYTQPDATTSSGEIPDVVISPTPAALTVTNAGKESTYQAGTSIVHFSQIEVVDRNSYHHRNGSVGCAETTTVYDLPQQVSFEYDGETVLNESLAVGKLGSMNFALMRALDESDIDLPHSVQLGDLEAEPTVVVVVEKVVVAAVALAQGVLTPASSLETPTATLPPGLSFERTTPTETGTTWVPFTAHIESSADSLDLPSTPTSESTTPQHTSQGSVDADTAGAQIGSSGADEEGRDSVAFPFVAHIENSAVTLAVPANPTGPANVITAVFSGRLVTATRISGAGPISDAVDAGRVVSAIDNVAQPTNALQVLNNAQASFSADTAASAIAAGLGLSSPVNEHSSAAGSNTASDVTRASQASLELIIGNSIVTATRAGSDLVIQGQKVAAGGSPISVAGQAVSLSPDTATILVGGSVINLSRGQGLGSTLTLDIGTFGVKATRVVEGLVIGRQTLSPGGPAISVDGRELSVAPDGTELIVGGSAVSIGSSQNVGAAANIPVIQLGTSRFTANAATQYNFDGIILAPGSQVVVAGTTVSLGPSASRLLIDGKAQQLSPPAITPAPLLTLGNRVYKPNLGSTYDIGSTLLVPGGQIVVSGTTISLPTSGRSLVLNGLARSLGSGGSSDESLATITAPPSLVINGMALSPNGGTSYVISGHTLTPGGMITLDGASGPQTISLNSAANMLYNTVDGHSFASRVGMVGAAPDGAPVLTIEGRTYSAAEYNAGSGATYLIGGSTLTPGGAITVQRPDGTVTISLVPAGTAIVLESSGVTSRSEIQDAHGVRQTNAPILTIAGQKFTAINNDATYLINGQTLSPGHIETVTIGGRRFIVSLSPHATILELVELASNGEAISTKFSTLFPATVAAPTTTSTDEAAAAKGASASQAGPTDTASADDEGSAPLSFTTTFAGAVIALSSLALAIWL